MLIDKLKDLALSRGIAVGDTRKLIQLSRGNKSDLSTSIAALYLSATKALNQYYGDLSLENENFGELQSQFLKTYSISNSNVRTVGFMFQRSVDKIANDVT
jgi:hypothetical protein